MSELLYPKQKFTLRNPLTREVLEKTGKQIEGKQMPEGFILKQTVNGAPGDPNIIGGDLNRGERGYQRTIKYGLLHFKTILTTRQQTHMELGTQIQKQVLTEGTIPNQKSKEAF